MALGVYLLLPRVAGFEEVGRSIARGSLIAVVALVAFETASLLAYGELVRVVLHSMGQPASRTLVQRTTLVGTSLGRTLPGGTTTALAVVVNALRRAGLNGVYSTAALADERPVVVVRAGGVARARGDPRRRGRAERWHCVGRRARGARDCRLHGRARSCRPPPEGRRRLRRALVATDDPPTAVPPRRPGGGGARCRVRGGRRAPVAAQPARPRPGSDVRGSQLVVRRGRARRRWP